MSIIKISSLSFSYKGNKIKPLDNISVEIEKGSIFGLIGKNGAGKTTLFQVLLGIFIPDSGTITIDGVEQTKLPKHKIGFVPEHPHYHKNFKLKEYLFYLNKISYISKEDKEINDLIHLVHLDDFKDEYIKNFSKGMLQRLGVAQTLLNQPEILFLDEPMSGLDLVGQNLMREIILNMNQQGTTILISSHNLYEIERLCDQIGILHDGKLKLINNDNIHINKEYCITLNTSNEMLINEFDSLFANEANVFLNERKITFPCGDIELYFKIMEYLSRKRIQLLKLETTAPSFEKFIIHYLSEEGESHE